MLIIMLITKCYWQMMINQPKIGISEKIYGLGRNSLIDWLGYNFYVVIELLVSIWEHVYREVKNRKRQDTEFKHFRNRLQRDNILKKVIIMKLRI